MEEKKFSRKFNRCPVCALREELAKIFKKPELILNDSGSVGFCEYLTEVAKQMGLATPTWRLYMDRRDGAVLDPNKAVLMPIGGKVPAYHIATDICMDCGTIYAVELAEGEAVIRTQDVPKGKIPPGFGSPSLS